ncbi:PTS sugar transporter subunit IIA [Luteimonas lutimaris]|uniref:PTS sugar transporter subunit IIA n=1 Tax=Luteimonas lutimaris TaxID=698645 RepID=A0ABP7N177_9GAMM
MPLADLLTAERIVMLTEPGSRNHVLDAAARLLGGASPMATAAIGAALHERELLGSTAIGHGVAIPHARSNAFDSARGVFLRLGHPVDFDARDHAPVDLVFAMSVPMDAQQQYLDTLGELAERFSSAEFRDVLRGARNLDALRGVLMGVPQPTMRIMP